MPEQIKERHLNLAGVFDFVCPETQEPILSFEERRLFLLTKFLGSISKKQLGENVLERIEYYNCFFQVSNKNLDRAEVTIVFNPETKELILTKEEQIIFYYFDENTIKHKTLPKELSEEILEKLQRINENLSEKFDFYREMRHKKRVFEAKTYIKTRTEFNPFAPDEPRREDEEDFQRNQAELIRIFGNQRKEQTIKRSKSSRRREIVEKLEERR